MNPPLRKVLLFAATLVPLFVVLVLLYPLVMPVYQHAVVSVANLFLRTMDPPFAIAIDGAGAWVASLLRPDGTRERFYGFAARDRQLLYLNLILLPALVLATPSPRVATRFIRLGLGLVLLFGFQVVAEVAVVRANLCLDLDYSSTLCAWVQATLGVSGQLFAVLLWILLTWDQWLTQSDTPVPIQGGAGIGRNAPCPCGSGRKHKHCCLS